MMQTTAAAAVALLLCATAVRADVYMHTPRGSNDRNCERNVNRNNGNRLFDSQNNAKGGYACPRAVGGQGQTLAGLGAIDSLQNRMYYYVGEKVYLEWTNQHGGGDNSKLHTEVIWQYACTDTLDPRSKFASGTLPGTPRDGIPTDGNDAATDRIPDNADSATPNTPGRLRFGMHESYDYYQECQRTSRNKGLYTADQNVNRNDARGTRQNPNGNRNGLECPEERDYYPYWRPSPWRDIALVTSEWSPNKATYYRENANQKKARGYCQPVDQQDYQQKRNQRRWYNNYNLCVGNGHNWVETFFDPGYTGTLTGNNSPDMMVVQGEETRVNQLGNSARNIGVAYPNGNLNTFSTNLREYCQNGRWALQNGRNQCAAQGGSTGVFQDQTSGRLWDDNTGQAMSANSLSWVVPNNVQDSCVLRLRYNISTWDFPGWQGGNRYLCSGADGACTANDPADTFTGEPGVNSTYNCQGDTQNGVACSRISPVTQDPYVQINGGNNAQGGNQILSLALNTNQYARTFQDRTYVFSIRRRPPDIPATATIVSFALRGKRGNIVQTYPAVEYDFTPDNLVMKQNDYMHIQWTGSDYNPQRGCNNGEGGPPDCQGCTNLQQQINAGNQNSRADRTNLVFMDVAGNNMPFGAVGTGVDRFSTALDTAQTPFASAATLWNLAYIGQDAQIAARNVGSCLTQDQLDAINNKNRRENHPLNCAKLNAAQHPYFDAGAVKVDNRGRFTAQSTRNNNFSNRDQTLNMCVAADDNDLTNCHTATLNPSTGAPNAHFSGGKTAAVIDGISIENNDPAVDAIAGETTAPIEKDNDGVGDGEKEACEARLHDFLSSIGIAGIIAIALALLMTGIIGTLIVQGLIRRYKGETWLEQKGTTV